MLAEVYARSVVEKLMRERVDSDVCQGNMSRNMYFLVTFFPLQTLANVVFLSKRIGTNEHARNLIYFRIFNLGLLNNSRAW